MHRERAEHALADGDRVRGERRKARAHQRGRVDDARIRRDVRPQNGLAVLDHPADGALARRELLVQLRGDAGIAVGERAAQPARRLVEPPHAHEGRVEELRDRAREVGEHLVGLERGRDQPIDLFERAQPLGVPRGLLVQPRVLDGGGRVRRETLQQREILRAERLGGVAHPAHRQHAERTVAQDERLHDDAAHAGRHEAPRRVGRARVVVAEEAAALGDGEPGEALARRQPLAGEILAHPRARDETAILLERPERAARLEETGGALDDQCGEPRRVEHRRQLALDVRERRDLLAAGTLDREQPCILQREGRLVGERLQQRRFVVGKLAAAAVGDAERADHHALGAQRHREDGHLARGAEIGLEIVGQIRHVVGERVGRAHRATLDDGASEHAHARRQHVTGVEGLAQAAAEGERGQRAVGLQQSHHRRLCAEQRQHALDGALGHVGDLERLAQRPRQPRQFFGLGTTLRRLRVQARVGQRERRLIGERLRQPLVGLAEDAAALAADRQHADHDVVDDERHRDRRVMPEGGDPRPQLVGLLDVGVREHVGGDDHASRLDGEAGDADAARQHGCRRDGRRAAGGGGDGHERAGARLDAKERGRHGGEQAAHAVGDPRAHDVGIERAREHAREVGERAHPIGLLGGLVDQPRVLDGDRGLAGERLRQLLVAGAERPPRAEAERTHHAPTDLQRHAEVGRVAERAIGGQMLRDHAGARGDVVQAQLALHRLPRGASEAGDDELVAFAKPEAGVVDVEQPRGLLRDGGQQRLGRDHAADLGVDLEQRRDMLATRPLARQQARVLERHRRRVGERREDLQLLRGIFVRLAETDRERAEHAIADEQRNAGEGGQPPRAQRFRVDERDVAREVRDGERRTGGDDAADEPLAHTHALGAAADVHAGAGADGERDAVVVHQPQARDGGIEHLARDVGDALEQLGVR